jgi:hypothetical protein
MEEMVSCVSVLCKLPISITACHHSGPELVCPVAVAQGLFYDSCLEHLYPPGTCGSFCNAHTYDCYRTEIHSACCDEGGTNCGPSSDVPLTCPVGCALVFPEFLEVCRPHIQAEGAAVVGQLVDFEAFETECLDADGLALVEYALDLQNRGCVIDLGTVSFDVDGATNMGHRRRQRRRAQYLSQYLSAHDEPACTWDEVDDLASGVDALCCADPANCADGTGPRVCDPGCAVAVHDFQNICGNTVAQILGAQSSRLQSLLAVEQTCLDAIDPLYFLNAISTSDCGSMGATNSQAVPNVGGDAHDHTGDCDVENVIIKNSWYSAQSSWKIEDPSGQIVCSGGVEFGAPYESGTVQEECCLQVEVEYTLTCLDNEDCTDWDGCSAWNGPHGVGGSAPDAWIEVGATCTVENDEDGCAQYCRDFTTGNEESHQLSFCDDCEMCDVDPGNDCVVERSCSVAPTSATVATVDGISRNQFSITAVENGEEACSSNGYYEQGAATHVEDCCLPPGQYVLSCDSDGGDGWGSGASIVIAGQTYCDAFYCWNWPYNCFHEEVTVTVI